jgi:hypothetical protein
VSSTNKTDRYDITEILLKVALSTINLSLNHITSAVQDRYIRVLHLRNRIVKQEKQHQMSQVSDEYRDKQSETVSLETAYALSSSAKVAGDVHQLSLSRV